MTFNLNLVFKASSKIIYGIPKKQQWFFGLRYNGYVRRVFKSFVTKNNIEF